MTRKFSGSAILMTALALALAAASAPAQEPLRSAFGATSYMVDWRVRYENVNQEGIAEEANALTSRVRAGFESGAIGKTRLLAEMAGSTAVKGQYNSTTNGRTSYPVVADPAGFAGINRFAIVNESLARTRLTLGRQRLILDDARFVGNVGWRQNEQTYDGLSTRITGEKFTADLAWLNQVNRIFGPDSPAGEWHGDIVLLNGARTFDFGKLTVFAYGMEFDDAPAASNETAGLTLSGSRLFGDTSLIWTLSAATQSEAGLNPSSYRESYAKLEGGVTRGRFTAALGFEVLGGDGANAFSTPLATLHAFQGWADKFLATPGNGIEDSYMRFLYRPAVTGPFDSLNLTAFFHQYDAELGSIDYGSELDLAAAAQAGRITLTLKYAAYDAAAFATDTDKLWLSMDYAF